MSSYDAEIARHLATIAQEIRRLANQQKAANLLAAGADREALELVRIN